MIGLLVFAAYLLVDALYALYTLAVTERRAARAASYSAAIYLLLACGVLAFTRSAWYIIPAAVGGWAGTFLAVRRSPRDDTQSR